MSKRQEIIRTASKLFREQGYHATTVRDIATAMGLKASSLYSHFDAKEEILWEIVSEAATAFNGSAESIDESLDPKSSLEQLIQGHFQVMTKELPNATVFFNEWRFLPEDLKTKMIEQRDSYEAHFRKAIQTGIDDGIFKVDDAKVATLFVMSALNWSYQWMKQDGPMQVSEITQHYTNLVMQALNYES